MTLAELWRAHQNESFPASCLKTEIDGVRLLSLDASAGACLTASLRTDGVPRPLPPAKRETLARGRDLARRAVATLGLDAPSTAYFSRLADLADAVLG